MVAKADTAFDLVLRPLERLLAGATAQSIAQIKLDPEVQARIEMLADRSANGTLSEEERAEYLEFVEAIDFLSIFQARARKAIDRQNLR